ncbi:MAG: LruC domain-containing protein [Bacteroides sp.]|nr:LruC domain-containing protein [Bacteroides sp.]
MDKNIKYLAALALSATLTGCMDTDVYQGPSEETLKAESEYFDFSISNEVTFNINYGSAAKSVLLQIYSENPMTYNSDGSFTVSGEPLYKIFTDSEGKFTGKVNLLSAIDKVYIYSPSWSVPTCLEATVENNTVSLDASSLTSVATRSAATTRATYTSRTIDGATNLYAIMTWGEYGKLDDCSVLEPSITEDIKNKMDVSTENLNAIQKLLWNGNDTKPNYLNNSQYVVDTEHVNTTIAKAYTDSEGIIKTVESAELYFTFLTEWAWYQNTLGYYYYESSNVPSSPDDVKKYILVPNASKANHVPFGVEGGWGYPYFEDSSNAPMALNTHIQLLYEDAEGKVSTEFPAGYTIGFFLIPNGYNTCTDSNTNPGDSFYFDKGIVYSNKEWNTNYSGQQSRFIAMNSTNGVVYGVEDGGEDASYDDLMFTIYGNPNEAIQDPDRPTINPDEDAIYTTETTSQIYAFEDQWPTGGDYDMNDVMITHKREITFNNVNSANNVTKVVDTFTPVQPAGSATYVDAFAVQYDSDLRGTIELPDGAVDETETSSVILFGDAKTVCNQAFVVTRTFSGNNVQKSTIEDDVLNPFIIAHYAAGATNRTEVHLPKHEATSLADAEQKNSADDAYYVNKDGKHPFAITLPSEFTPVTETVSIEVEYPDFTKWVESNGTTNTDWYKNYVKSEN